MENYGGIDLLETMEQAKLYNFTIARLIKNNSKGTHLLDFGSGRGQFASALKDLGFTVDCIEPDKHLSKHLRSLGFTVYSSLAECPNTYDTIYSINVLEHIEDHNDIAQQMSNKLNPQGRMIIYVPAFECLYSALDKKIGHHRRYTKKTLLPLFSQLKTLRCSYVDSLGFPASLALKWFGRDDGHISARAVWIYDRLIFPLSLACDYLLQSFFGKNIFYLGQK